MKKVCMGGLVVFLFLGLWHDEGFGALSFTGDGHMSVEQVIADFNSGEKPNNIGGEFGTWDYDMHDETQGCVMSFSSVDSQTQDGGHSIQLQYDVQSSNPAFNGFWMKLQGIDVSAFNRLRFYVKGDAAAGQFTSKFKVELKNALGKRAIYIVEGITSEWSEVRIAFKNTRAIKDWTEMTEFTIVFSDLVATYKEGSIFIDDIAFLYEDE